MAEILVYTAGCSGTAPYAAAALQKAGIPLVDHPTPDATHLLLDVPSREIPEGLLDRLPESITVVGGNLTDLVPDGYRKLDLLKTEAYLAQNAAITADCAIRVAVSRMTRVFSGSHALVIGWGRIGKCLAGLLKNIGCRVTVAARKESDRAILAALGYDTADPESLTYLQQYHLIYNTAPAPVLDKTRLCGCPDTLKIDLASRPGLEGADVIWARGLPGLYAPESSGNLIADIFLKEARL